MPKLKLLAFEEEAVSSVLEDDFHSPLPGSFRAGSSYKERVSTLNVLAMKFTTQHDLYQ